MNHQDQYLCCPLGGHPEGNIDIDPNGSSKNVDEALSWKNEFSKRTDASMAITTQFCFDSSSVIEWANNVKTSGINMPVHIGIAGQQYQYAQACLYQMS